MLSRLGRLTQDARFKRGFGRQNGEAKRQSLVGEGVVVVLQGVGLARCCKLCKLRWFWGGRWNFYGRTAEQ